MCIWWIGTTSKHKNFSDCGWFSLKLDIVLRGKCIQTKIENFFVHYLKFFPFFWKNGTITVTLIKKLFKKLKKCINPRPPKGGGMVATPPVIFPRQLFWATEGCQTAICSLYSPYNASFHKNGSKFGGTVWVGGVVKGFGRGGGWWNSMILILPKTKYLIRYMLVTWFVDKN